MLEIQNNFQRNIGPSEIELIPKLHKNQISYNEFFNNFMLTNQPIILTEISTNWNCTKNWICHKNNMETINCKFLKDNIPNQPVPIADCSKKYSNSHEKIELNFYDFLDYWKSRDPNDTEKLYYLKDWHLKNTLPKYDFYKVPQYFGSDWLNEWLLETGQDDYRFVYMGPKGTWTPFHVDVFNSFSWSTNIFGKKKWILLKPKEELKLRDQFGNLPFSIDENHLMDNEILHFVVIQNSGESIFVPSGWYHQVWNLEDTISVNHNWFNGCNISEIWSILVENYVKVCREIEDCHDMDNFEEHCQIMLKASHGMNFNDFLDLLKIVVQNRMKELNVGNSGDGSINGFVYGENHIKFDLMAVDKVCETIEETCRNFPNINDNILSDCIVLRGSIQEIL